MVYECPICDEATESVEKLASHIKHMSWNKNEPRHISWLGEHNLQPLEITKICAILKDEVKETCNRRKECEFFTSNKSKACIGCGFKHFEKIFIANRKDKLLKYLYDEYFKEITGKEKKGTGGRISLDKPIKNLIKREIPELKEMKHRDLHTELSVNWEKINIKVKCDGAFRVDRKYIFYEIKGYGDNTNDILSTITAAQLLKETDKYKQASYYYIGVSASEKDKKGLKSEDFLNKGRPGISPYVNWAENKGFLKFYGILDLKELLDDIRSKVNK